VNGVIHDQNVWSGGVALAGSFHGRRVEGMVGRAPARRLESAGGDLS
jgi:hypothetical protein